MLPRLRANLDFMPSPVEDRPGLLIRDSWGYSDSVLIVPPELVQCLALFDGEQTDNDLRAILVRLSGQLDVSPIMDQLRGALSQAGFLEDEVYFELRETRQREFASSAVREPAHAGTAYPDQQDGLRTTLLDYMKDPANPKPSTGSLAAIAAPHVSPFGGWESYREAYSALDDSYRDRTFVVLGTSHYGEPARFGLTRKPFATPFGTAMPNLALINELADEPAVIMEDYCHAIEHSIEFQVLFLQYLYGPDIRIVPILCGSLAETMFAGRRPEEEESLRRFFGRLGEIHAREGNRLLWVLGIDMAHMGARYGDRFTARADQGEMTDVARRDHQRIRAVSEADSDGFRELVAENGDDLKWCGTSPVYTFLRAVPNVSGSLRRYEQWNIDEESVVSFAALSFARS